MQSQAFGKIKSRNIILYLVQNWGSGVQFELYNVTSNRDDILLQFPINKFNIHVNVRLDGFLEPTLAMSRHLQLDVQIKQESVKNIFLKLSNKMFQPRKLFFF